MGERGGRSVMIRAGWRQLVGQAVGQVGGWRSGWAEPRRKKTVGSILGGGGGPQLGRVGRRGAVGRGHRAHQQRGG